MPLQNRYHQIKGDTRRRPKRKESSSLAITDIDKYVAFKDSKTELGFCDGMVSGKGEADARKMDRCVQIEPSTEDVRFLREK